MRGASWLGAFPPGSFFGDTKTYPGAAAGEPAFTLMAGGRRSGRVRNSLACPDLPGSAEASVREAGSQPTVPVSAIPAAPAETTPRNLRRVIVPLSLPLSAHFSAKFVLSPAWRRKQPRSRTSSDRIHNLRHPGNTG